MWKYFDSPLLFYLFSCNPRKCNLETTFPVNSLPAQFIWCACLHAKLIQLCLILCNPMDCSLPGSYLCPWDSPGKNIAVGCHALFQGNLPNPRIKPWSPVLQADSYYLSHQGSLINLISSNKSHWCILIYHICYIWKVKEKLCHCFLELISRHFWAPLKYHFVTSGHMRTLEMASQYFHPRLWTSVQTDCSLS